MSEVADPGGYADRCGGCARGLGGEDAAFVCSEGRTFCAGCARTLDWRCPDCGGELARRARRSSGIGGRTPRSARTARDAKPIRIARATSADAEDAAPLFDAYRQFYHQRGDVPAARRFLRDRLHHDESVVFLARSDRIPVGFAQLYPSFTSIRLGRMWILNDLYVVPSARRRGVGDRLLERCEEFVAGSGAEGAWLETAVDNPAQRLYARRGWKLDREFLHFDWDVPNTRPRSARRGTKGRARRRRRA